MVTTNDADLTRTELLTLKAWLNDRIGELQIDREYLEDECPGLWEALGKLKKELATRAKAARKEA